ncbi:MAG: hypothetical protein HY583_01105, partial [Candidatus Omnitrophica bacterium]|nr:hypothetical protein [Candidatus Omnitrophota bacterium]
SKILMSFSNEEIRALVETARFSDPENANLLSEILIARRDLIGRYWFSRVTPLNQVRLFQMDDGTYQIRFQDLQIQYGFVLAENTRYRYRIIVPGQKGSGYQEFSGNAFSFGVPSMGGGSQLMIQVQAKYDESKWSEPPLKINLSQSAQDASLAVVQVDHGN